VGRTTSTFQPLEAELLRMQLTAGNRAVSRLIEGTRLDGRRGTTPVEHGVPAGVAAARGTVRRTIDHKAIVDAAKVINPKFARFRKSSISPVIAAVKKYNADENPHKLAKIMVTINEAWQKDGAKKYLPVLQTLMAKLTTEMTVFIGDAAIWTGSRKELYKDATLIQAAFQMCSTALDKGKLLYRLKGSAAWKRQWMAAVGISHNDFREALVKLGVFESGTAGHKSGPEVDKLIEEKLTKNVQNNLETRGRITGRIAVVDAADWNVIGKEQYGAKWKTKVKTLNAFVDRTSDPPRVFVNKDRGNAGTAIHEACHMWGDAGRPINSLSHDLNEGVTEYFARKVCKSLTPPIPRTVYAKQYNIANKLVETIGEDNVAAAFFDGTVASISDEFGATRWANFLKHIEEGKYDRAEAVLEKVKAATTTEEEDEGLFGAFAGLFGEAG
jgi:hypothetical protein